MTADATRVGWIREDIVKRRTLDIAFSIGGIIFSVLLVVVGLVLSNQASFAESYVADQFAEQQIKFDPVDELTDEEKGIPCLIDYAGMDLTTGKQAECYSKLIGLHMDGSAERGGFPGATYASLGGPQSELRAELQAATDAGQPTEAIQAELTAVTGLRETMFKGETLRGLLLTTYGFSIFGERAQQAAWVTYAAAAVLFVLSLAGVAHAFRTRKDETILLVTDADTAKEVVKDPAKDHVKV